MTISISKEVLAKLKSINLADFISSQYHVAFTSSNIFEYSCRCPHPDHDDKKPSFSIWYNKNNQTWNWCCHSCHCGKKNTDTKDKNYGTDIIAFIRWMSDNSLSNHIYTFVEAALIAAKYAGIEIGNTVTKVANDLLSFKQQMAKGLHYALNFYPKAKEYLYNRGLSDKDIDIWKIGFTGERIVFPLFDRQNQVVSYSARIFKESSNEAKYINGHNSQIFNKSYYLYGINKVDTSLDYLIITEGAMDVILAYKYGLKNTVATLGTVFKETHLETIKKMFPNINQLIFMFDADEAGRKALTSAAEKAREAGFLVNYVELPESEDLCDFANSNKEQTSELIFSMVIPYFYKEFEQEIKEFDRFTINFQNKLINKTISLSKHIVNQREKQLIYSFLRNKFNVVLSSKEHINSA